MCHHASHANSESIGVSQLLATRISRLEVWLPDNNRNHNQKGTQLQRRTKPLLEDSSLLATHSRDLEDPASRRLHLALPFWSRGQPRCVKNQGSRGQGRLLRLWIVRMAVYGKPQSCCNQSGQHKRVMANWRGRASSRRTSEVRKWLFTSKRDNRVLLMRWPKWVWFISLSGSLWHFPVSGPQNLGPWEVR